MIPAGGIAATERLTGALSVAAPRCARQAPRRPRAGRRDSPPVTTIRDLPVRLAERGLASLQGAERACARAWR